MTNIEQLTGEQPTDYIKSPEALAKGKEIYRLGRELRARALGSTGLLGILAEPSSARQFNLGLNKTGLVPPESKAYKSAFVELRESESRDAAVEAERAGKLPTPGRYTSIDVTEATVAVANDGALSIEIDTSSQLSGWAIKQSREQGRAGATQRTSDNGQFLVNGEIASIYTWDMTANKEESTGLEERVLDRILFVMQELQYGSRAELRISGQLPEEQTMEGSDQ